MSSWLLREAVLKGLELSLLNSNGIEGQMQSGGAAGNRSDHAEGSAGDDFGGAVDELFGAAAGLYLVDRGVYS